MKFRELPKRSVRVFDRVEEIDFVNCRDERGNSAPVGTRYSARREAFLRSRITRRSSAGRILCPGAPPPDVEMLSVDERAAEIVGAAGKQPLRSTDPLYPRRRILMNDSPKNTRAMEEANDLVARGPRATSGRRRFE